jgi:hypothetical protein
MDEAKDENVFCTQLATYFINAPSLRGCTDVQSLMHNPRDVPAEPSQRATAEEPRVSETLNHEAASDGAINTAERLTSHPKTVDDMCCCTRTARTL